MMVQNREENTREPINYGGFINQFLPAFKFVVMKKCCQIYTHIYTYRHPHTDCFVVSQVFSVARHASFSKLGSKPG